jgi:hypothetical protein
LPDRLNDLLNVKDFGALGDGATDDTDAIRAAVDYAYTQGPALQRSSIIFFPPGTYIVGKNNTIQLVFDNNPRLYSGTNQAWIRIIGSGRDVTIIKGYRSTSEQLESENNGFLCSCGSYGGQVLEFRDLSICNTSTDATSGALMIEEGSQNAGLRIINCHFKGVVACYSQLMSFGQSIRDCLFTCSRPVTTADKAGRSPHFTYANFQAPSGSRLHSNQFGSVGCYIAGGNLINCRVTGFDVGFALEHPIGSIIGCSFSRCGVAIAHGLCGGDPSGGGQVQAPGEPPIPAYGNWTFSRCTNAISNHIDRCMWGLLVYSLEDGIIAANLISGETGPNDPASIHSMNWSSANGGTATVTTPGAHNLPSGVSSLVLVTDPIGWTPDNSGNQIVSCTNTASNQFTYSLSANPGSFSSASWNYSLEYGITTKAVFDSLIAANALDARVSIASFDIVHSLSPGGITGYGQNTALAMRGPYNWNLNDFNRSGGWEFKQCGIPTSYPAGIPFAGLPNGYYVVGPIEGTEFTVVDAATQTSFVGTVTGGGSNHYKVRYNGTNWTRVG